MTLAKNIKYTIIHVNDRAKEQMDSNKKILKSFDYVSDIKFFNGNTGKAWDVINHMGIRTDVWKPYDGRQFPPLPGEYGIWLSTINVWDYIISNDLNELLVIEDDVSLSGSAEKTIRLLMEDLPNNWDFLSLYHFQNQNKIDQGTDIGSKNIHKSTNQPAAAQAILYSNKGAKKLRRLVQRKGIEYTSDCFIFEQSRLGYINGYSIIPGVHQVLSHKHKDIPSSIDPQNIRNVKM